MFTGCGTALVTPFKADLSLDTAATRRLIQRAMELPWKGMTSGQKSEMFGATGRVPRQNSRSFFQARRRS